MHFGFWQQGKTDRKCKSRREREREKHGRVNKRCSVEDKKDKRSNTLLQKEERVHNKLMEK